MTSAVAAPSAGALTGTSKRGGDGGRPPRKPSAPGGPTSHYSAEDLDKIRKKTTTKLDLAFAIQALESAIALADAGEAYNLGVEATVFLDRNNRRSLRPTHQTSFKKTNGTGRTDNAYGLVSLLDHTARDRVVREGDDACTQCQNGKGNFKDCVTVATDSRSLYSGACTNCAFPNRYKQCSLYNGTAIGRPKGSVAAPYANEVATRTITRSRAATQPTQHTRSRTEPQVVIYRPRPAVAETPASVAGSSRSATTRQATPASVADDLYNVSLSPPGRGYSRHSSSPLPFVRSTPAGGPIPTLQEALDGTLSVQQRYILAHIEWIPNGRTEAPAWRDGYLDLLFEHFVNPSETEFNRATIEDAIDFDITSDYADFQDGDTWVVASTTARAMVGVGRITINALRLLHRRYRASERIRRSMRYSSEGPQ